MKKDQNFDFNGFPLKAVRDYFRCRHSDVLDLKQAEEYGAQWAGKSNFIETLLEHQLVIRRDQYLEVTEHGRRLGAMTLTPRMNRASVMRLVEQVEKRALEVNAEARFGMQFELLGFFGSVLNEQADDVGDLDVVFRLSYKPRWKARISDLVTWHVAHFPQDQRTCRPWSLLPLFNRPLQHIKARQARISLHTENDIADMEAHNQQPVQCRLLWGVRKWLRPA